MKINSIQFFPQKILLDIHISQRHLTSNQIGGLAEVLIECFPGLRDHYCDNPNNNHFLDEIKNTETAHILEHLIMEQIFIEDPNIEKVTGYTRWNWQVFPRYSYQIEFDYIEKEKFITALNKVFPVLYSILNQKIPLQRNFALDTAITTM